MLAQNNKSCAPLYLKLFLRHICKAVIWYHYPCCFIISAPERYSIDNLILSHLSGKTTFFQVDQCRKTYQSVSSISFVVPQRDKINYDLFHLTKTRFLVSDPRNLLSLRISSELLALLLYLQQYQSGSSIKYKSSMLEKHHQIESVAPSLKVRNICNYYH